MTLKTGGVSCSALRPAILQGDGDDCNEGVIGRARSGWDGIYFLIDAFSFKITLQVDQQIKNKKMQKSVFRKCLAAAVAFSCGIVTTLIPSSVHQVVAQKPQREILVAQSAIDESTNVKFESRGCRRTKPTEVTCDVLITNIGKERQQLGFSADPPVGQKTTAIDTSGTVYPVKIVQSGIGLSKVGVSIGHVCNCFHVSLPPGIPTKVTFAFEIPQEVTQLAALDVGHNGSNRIAISNIGAITP